MIIEILKGGNLEFEVSGLNGTPAMYTITSGQF